MTSTTGMNKAQICDRYQISLNTVRQTLKACGLDTGKKTYGTEDMETFEQARNLLQSGRTYDQVAQHFGVSAEPAQKEEQAGQQRQNVAFMNLGEMQGMFDQMALAGMAQMINASAERVSPLATPLLMSALAQQMPGVMGDFNTAVRQACASAATPMEMLAMWDDAMELASQNSAGLLAEAVAPAR